MKKTLITLAVLNIASVAYADEGMWMPQQLPQVAKELKAAGLKLDPNSLTKLTEFPMGAIVSLGGCSASFVSPQGLVATNHHCVYGSVAYNSKPERNLLANGFLANSLEEELPAAPGSRIFVTKEVTNVSDKIIDKDVARLTGKKRVDAIEKNSKTLVAECEKDAGHRCNVYPYYGGLEFYMIKQMEIRDVRLVHAPAEGVGKFGGDTDNWMWPRHTGDYGFYRAYVSKDGKAADYSKDNVPYVPKHYLKLAKDGLKEGDFVMVLGYPGRTNRHRLPSEVAYTFDWNYPAFVKASGEALSIIAKETADSPDAKLKYASQVAGINNYYKNRQGMLDSYAGSDFLARKTKEHEELKTWINSNPARAKEFGDDIVQVEKLIAERDAQGKRDFFLERSFPRLLSTARALYRLANESTKPDAERKAGYQVRDLPRFKAGVEAVERNYVENVDKALVLNSLKQYAAQPAKDRNADFDSIMGIKDGMSEADLKALLDKIYAGSKLADKASRAAWLSAKPEDFKASDDSFIKAAVAMYPASLKREAEEEELAGKIQQSYANYMKAKIAYMKSKGQAVYPDANSTLRVTFGKVAGRDHGTADGLAWAAFTTVNGIPPKATGQGEFNAPAAQLAAIKAKDFGKYVDPHLKTVPVAYLATLDITGGNSGSAALNAKGELIGLAFDGTLDSIISDWDYNKANTRSIQVDLRYMLWQMKHVDKADRLIKEMGAE
ncbi:S46 family peptidase [Undibacterium oligocarboniphilum]|uniref:Dipeptidyl-peptidase n=1 Tax=Undibacterium oligocarboniphilum TaxID=666702 RepID=A0A850QEC5_9BURK|nr:S46 family peptidase [Undibacterium oligocarboniphilum]MBC3869933.1 S46 family peptidase [Undibacterium oligocarboniphilum]NVO77549.1 S46 family peptidase [Undibacterium oligocarboniphilum]